MIWAIVGPLVTRPRRGPALGVSSHSWDVADPSSASRAGGVGSYRRTGTSRHDRGRSRRVRAVAVDELCWRPDRGAGPDAHRLGRARRSWYCGVLTQLRRVDLGEEDDDRPSITELLSRRRTDSWQMGTITVVEIEDPRYVGVAIPGTPSTIFVSRAVQHALPPSYLSAFLAHEAAHLRQHHTLLRRLGAWHTACLPKRSGLRERAHFTDHAAHRAGRG